MIGKKRLSCKNIYIFFIDYRNNLGRLPCLVDVC